MLTLGQISAVLSLLLAFGVPQTEVNNVQAILENSQKPVQQAAIGIPTEIITQSVPTCTVTLTPKTTKNYQGTYDTVLEVTPYGASGLIYPAKTAGGGEEVTIDGVLYNIGWGKTGYPIQVNHASSTYSWLSEVKVILDDGATCYAHEDYPQE